MIRLNTNEKLIEEIRTGLLSGSDRIKVRSASHSDDLMFLYKIGLGKCAEIINYDNGRIYIQQDFDGKSIILNPKAGWHELKKRKCEFTLEDSKILANYAEKIVQNLNLSSKSDMQKAIAIYDYLSATVTYEHGDSAHDAWGALIDKKAVCEGIAFAYCLLANKCGLDAVIISGTLNGGGHAWNMICVDGITYHVDATLNLESREHKVKNYDYIFLKDSDLKGRTWERSVYPSCNSCKHNYFYITHSYANNENEVADIIERQLKNKKAVYFRYSDNIKMDDMKIQKFFSEGCAKTRQFISSAQMIHNPKINAVQILYK